MKIKPWHGKWVSRRRANIINDMFSSSKKPDRTQMQREAEEFKEYMLHLRKQTILRGEKW